VLAEDLKNASHVEAFFDNLVPKLMEEHHVPGVAISLVKDGNQLFAKGYGYANLDTGEPVHAEETLFRIASISKLFTWIAVYSNYETCLAALIVEEVSGMTFEDYIEKRITQPLGMNRTTIAQPLPDRLASDMSLGYVYGKDGYVPQEFELIRVAPRTGRC
jgi:CubicO group peptidase (beta-lactamase class C family)